MRLKERIVIDLLDFERCGCFILISVGDGIVGWPTRLSDQLAYEVH